MQRWVESLRSLLRPSKMALRALGYEFVRAPSDRWLVAKGIQTVIDVGANQGQFASLARHMFPDATIYSFEPIRECYDSLTKKFSGDPKFVAFPFALGDHDGHATFHKNRYTPSSSLLDMTTLHKESFPQTVKESLIEVDIHTLDGVMQGRPMSQPILAKLDVQGFEDRVIEGGSTLLTQVRIVICEVSFDALYASQPTFDRINDQLRGLGFGYKGNWSQLLSPKDGSVLQADAIFEKQS